MPWLFGGYFFKRKLYPWNKRAKIIVFVTPVVFDEEHNLINE
jgi:hypothetical protein